MYDQRRMSTTSHVRRVVVFICLVALLLAAVAPGASALPFAILLTLCFVIAIAVSAPLPQRDKQSCAWQVEALPAFSPRPPPAR